MTILLNLIKYCIVAIFTIFTVYGAFNIIIAAFGFILAVFTWLTTDSVVPLLWQGPLGILVWILIIGVVFFISMVIGIVIDTQIEKIKNKKK